MIALAFAPETAVQGSSLSDRVMRLLQRVDFRRADAPEEREAIFRLRYTAYRREGTIPSNPSGRLTDRFDETANAWIFGIYVDGQLASSIRLHSASKANPELPALGVFGDLLAPEIANGKIVVDPTRFVCDRAAARSYPELCYVTTRLAVLASEYCNANLLLATVRAEHQAFYRRVFGHRLICAPRPYPSLTKPISLMALNYSLARERLTQRHPFLRSSFFERRMLFARPLPNTAGLRAA